MKRLVIPVLLVPSVAMAGVVMVDDPTSSEAAPAPSASIATVLVSENPAQGQVVVGGPSEPTTQVVSAPEPSKTWTAPAGSTLRESIQKWADEAQWHLVWNAPDGPDKQVNYPIVIALQFQGALEKAVADCISLYEKAPKPLAVLIQPEQRALIVQLKNK
ncbi:toxin co-regulated pilus biosynthesis Q family protein [Burkholderia multivorans]|uniref:TcpQ domain-containing protein n=1 Tax=Burkholderia multivorans TaxID=87883 RepID=UPI001C96D23E|nr:TcpQ domain-containing protein [Burkholderia multivorans]MBY4672242.1 toxin co-regulated pilus biosynthesis Q family protein [Burkholderia multivorans]